jgi:hypothetical protein
MSDAIKHLHLNYDSLEDRILLTISTLSGQVFYAWLTRRYCKLLIPALQGLHPQTHELILPPVSDTETNASRRYQNDTDLTSITEYPLGNEPIVLNTIRFIDTQSEQPKLALEPNKGAGISLNYHPPFVRAFSERLAQAITQTDWQLDLPPMMGFASSHRLQ